MLKGMFAVLLAMGTPAFAAEELPSAYEKNKALLGRLQDGTTIFTIEQNGSLTHIQSGLVCTGTVKDYSLDAIYIFNKAAPADDVGCDYARRSDDGNIVSKLTVFFVKGEQDTNLDTAFSHYRDEVLRASPGATPTPSQLHIKDETGVDNPAYKSSGFTIALNGEPYHSELIVGFVKPWIVEVRSTYKNDSIHVDMSKGKEAALADALRQKSDITNPYIAFLESKALGK